MSSYVGFITELAKDMKDPQTNEGVSLVNESKKVLDSAVKNLVLKVINEATSLLRGQKQETILYETAKLAVKLALPESLFQDAHLAAEKAVLNFNQTRSGSKTKRAQLHLPVPRISNALHATKYRVSALSPVYVTGAIQHVVERWLAEAVAMKPAKVVRVTPHHLQLAKDAVPALGKLFSATIAHGGVTPHIACPLVKKRKQCEQEQSGEPAKKAKKAAPKKKAAAKKAAAPKKSAKKASKAKKAAKEPEAEPEQEMAEGESYEM